MRKWVKLVRPSRWIKNLLVFSAPLFAGAWTQPSNLFYVFVVFGAFSLLASSLYVLNDWLDRERDRKHPTKKDRPLAAGTVSGRQGLVLSVGLFAGSLFLLGGLPVERMLNVAVVLGVYLVMMVGYNVGLKAVPVLEMVLISLGLLLRALAGAVAVDVPVTNWFLLTILFVSLLLVAGKRRNELLAGGSHDPSEHRRVLEVYGELFLDQVIALMTGASLVTYALYTIEGAGGVLTGGPALTASVVLVVFGFLRYLLLIYSGERGDQPERLFLTDFPLLLSVALWVAYILLLSFW